MKRFLLYTIACLSTACINATAKSPGSNLATGGLYFVENKGQITDQYGGSRDDIQYALHAPGLNVFIGNGEIHYQFSKPTSREKEVETYRLDVKLIGANKSNEIVSELLPANNNYRNHATATMMTAQTATKLIYKNIYPGIDWAIYVKNGKLEYDFIVAEGADATVIKQQYFGASTVEIAGEGGLEIKTPMGSITEHTPVAYLEDGQVVKSKFNLTGSTVTFSLADYKGKVTIDPVVEWGTYYGGTAFDEINSVTTDGNGDVYACGSSSSANDIATTGSFQQTIAGMSDGFVAKFNSAGVRLWCTYYGGTDDDFLYSVACDNTGDVYACGRSLSSGINSPVVHQSTMYGLSDAYLIKLNSSGLLLYCTYYGGYSNEFGNGVKCDADGNVFMCGSTTSGNNIGTPGTHQAFQFGGSQAFLVKFNSAGVRQWGTYFGGTSDEYGNALDIDSAGFIYVCGRATSFDYVGTTGTFQPSQPGGNDGFLAKFVNSNGDLSWSSYCGDTGDDEALSVVCGASYRVYLTGRTDGTTSLFTPGAHQTANGGNMDGFLQKFDSTGAQLWGTYYGGAGDDYGQDVACDANGNIWLTGSTTSASDIATPGSYQENNQGGNDGYLVQFDEAGTRLWASYYGSPDGEDITTVACNSDGIYIGGNTEGGAGVTTPGAHQTTFGGGIDGVLAKFVVCQAPTVGALTSTTFCQGDNVVLTGPVGVGLTYQWLQNGTEIAGATSTTYAALNSGDYSVIVNNGACTDTSVELTVTVNPLPVPIVTQTGSDLSTGSFTSYQWNLAGNPISGATAQSYTPTQGGDYSVTVTDGNGCQGTSVVLQYLDVVDITKTQLLKLYPNPNNGSFIVSGVVSADVQVATVSMIDVLGRVLFTEDIQVKQGGFEKEINLDKAASGTYIMKIVAGNNVNSLPFVVK